MTQAGKSFSIEKKFRDQLARKAFLTFFLSAILPTVIFGISSLIITDSELAQKTSLLFSFSIGLGLILSYGVYRYVKKYFVEPLYEIAETIKEYEHDYFTDNLPDQRNNELEVLAFSTNNLINKISSSQQSLSNEVTSLINQIHTIREITQIAASVSNLTAFLQRSADIIIEKLNHSHAAIYLFDPIKKSLIIQANTLGATKLFDLEKHKIEEFANLNISQAYLNNKPKVSPKIEDNSFSQFLPAIIDAKSEASIPISAGMDVFGVLDILDAKEDAFTLNEIISLQTITDQIAIVIQNFQITDNTDIAPSMATSFFKASHTITKSETAEIVFNELKNVFRNLPFPSIFFVPERSELIGEFLVEQEGKPADENPFVQIPIASTRLADFIPNIYPITVRSIKQQREYLPEPLVTFCQEIEFNNLTLYPLFLDSNLTAFLLIGTVGEDNFPTTMKSSLSSLIDITRTSLERVTALNTITDRFTELQTLYAVSQSISTETNLNQLYEVIHQQVVNVMGDINFLIALYSDEDKAIEIPYMDDGDEIISVPPFPLGQGLTSIIIRTRQPLMLVQDTINRSRALGAIVTGDKPALSWLGVPIIAGKDILGAIVVQDLEQEDRFNDDDMLLLTTLAAQIAISVRNTKLMEETRKLADREITLSKISAKISQSIDIENILKIAVRELGQLPNVTDASIHLRAPR